MINIYHLLFNVSQKESIQDIKKLEHNTSLYKT